MKTKTETKFIFETKISLVAYALSIDTKLDKLGWPWTGISSHILEGTTAKQMKIATVATHWRYF